MKINNLINNSLKLNLYYLTIFFFFNCTKKDILKVKSRSSIIGKTSLKEIALIPNKTFKENNINKFKINKFKPYQLIFLLTLINNIGYVKADSSDEGEIAFFEDECPSDWQEYEPPHGRCLILDGREILFNLCEHLKVCQRINSFESKITDDVDKIIAWLSSITIIFGFFIVVMFCCLLCLCYK